MAYGRVYVKGFVWYVEGCCKWLVGRGIGRGWGVGECEEHLRPLRGLKGDEPERVVSAWTTGQAP